MWVGRFSSLCGSGGLTGLNVLTYLTAYLDACGHIRGKPLTSPDLERFLSWTAAPEDLSAWAKPPAPS